MNIGTLRGENSIHILNRIIIQTSVNDEFKFNVNECVNDLCALVVSSVDRDESSFDLLSNSYTTHSTTATATSSPKKYKPYLPYKDDSYREILLAYGLMKHVYDTNHILEKIIDNQKQINLPLLSGFFATYLPNTHRPISKITFLPPINENPCSLTTSQLCLESAKVSLIDSHYQKEAVVVVDEKIYSICMKVSFSTSIYRSISTIIDRIRLATKFLRFFDIFFFIYFSFLRESAISYLYTICICGSSPTI